MLLIILIAEAICTIAAFIQHVARTLQRLGDWLYNLATGKRFDNYTPWDHNRPVWSDAFYRSYGEAQWHKLHPRAGGPAADCVRSPANAERRRESNVEIAHAPVQSPERSYS
ncbi:MAG: hypothetical protein HZB28_08895 [Methylocystis sp.]|nr:hypothetical protein [Methylocystis sp.]